MVGRTLPGLLKYYQQRILFVESYFLEPDKLAGLFASFLSRTVHEGSSTRFYTPAIHKNKSSTLLSLL